MIKLFFLLTLTLIKAANGLESSPSKWNEEAYISYIKNVALYPNMVPMTKDEFDKLTIDRGGRGTDFSNFEQKFNNFENNQNQNFQSPAQNNFANFKIPVNTHNMQGFQGYSHLQNQNLGNGYLAQNNLLSQLASQQSVQQQQNFGGVLNQNNGLFGAALPSINLQTIEPEKFQNEVNVFMKTHGLTRDLQNLLNEQQRQQSQLNQVMYPSTSYGSPIPGSYPQSPPQISSPQQDEVLKLMKLLLSKFDAQITTTTTTTPQPNIAQHSEFEFKLSPPKQIPPTFPNPELESFATQQISNTFNSPTVESFSSNQNKFKQFDFDQEIEINKNPVNKYNNYNEYDTYKSNNNKFKDDEFFHFPSSQNFKSPPKSFGNVNAPSYKNFNHPSTSFESFDSPKKMISKPKFRAPMKQRFHNQKNRFKNGYPSLTYDSIRKPNPHKRSPRRRKSRTPRKTAGLRLQFKKT